MKMSNAKRQPQLPLIPLALPENYPLPGIIAVLLPYMSNWSNSHEANNTCVMPAASFLFVIRGNHGFRAERNIEIHPKISRGACELVKDSVEVDMGTAVLKK